MEAMAVELAVAAATLPRLRALEITFFPPGIADTIREVVDLQVAFPAPRNAVVICLRAL